jgi:hypothetical protein
MNYVTELKQKIRVLKIYQVNGKRKQDLVTLTKRKQFSVEEIKLF